MHSSFLNSWCGMLQILQGITGTSDVQTMIPFVNCPRSVKVHHSISRLSRNYHFSSLYPYHLSSRFWSSIPLFLGARHSYCSLNSSQSDSTSRWARPLIRYSNEQLGVDHLWPSHLWTVCRDRGHLCCYCGSWWWICHRWTSLSFPEIIVEGFTQSIY